MHEDWKHVKFRYYVFKVARGFDKKLHKNDMKTTTINIRKSNLAIRIHTICWSPNTMYLSVFLYNNNNNNVILGPHPEWLYYRGLSSRPTTPPAPTLASTFSFPSANHLRESLGGDTIPGGPPEPARFRQGLTLYERWRVLLTPFADWSREDGGLVPEHGERGRGKRTSRGG